MKAIWLGKSIFCGPLGKEVQTGKEYTGPGHIIHDHIGNGLAKLIKVPKKGKKED